MIKDAVRNTLRFMGIDVRRHVAEVPIPTPLQLSLERFGINFVIDVGANTGQFASGLRRAGYSHDILSFEPLDAAFAVLSRHASQDARWHVHPRCAVGDEDGDIRINVSENSVSSSVLPMLEAHALAAPNSTYVASQTVPIVKLDTVMPAYMNSAQKVFLKIDTQGFETQVLNGAKALLERTHGILCELSLVPLYEGQALWTDLIEQINAGGFELWAIETGFTDPRDGRTLQVDAMFFKRDKIRSRR